MAKKQPDMMPKIGAWAFTGGMALAVLAGLLGGDLQATATTVLVLMGLIVGFINVSSKETTEFLVATIALMATAGALNAVVAVVFSTITIAGAAGFVQGVLTNFQAFVAPAAGVVAVKALFEAAKEPA